MSRQKPSHEVELAVLSKSRRHCALCFHFEFDIAPKRGQIAHIDNDSSNSVEANLVWLCLKHHDEYHVKSPMTKSISPSELKLAKNELEEFIQTAHSNLIPSLSESFEKPQESNEHVTAEVYNLRIPIYKAFFKFIVGMISKAGVEIESMYEYMRDTHEALFLYGYEIHEYLREVYRKAISLHLNQLRMKDPSRYSNDDWQNLLNEDADLMLWFSDQVEQGQIKFYKYLSI